MDYQPDERFDFFLSQLKKQSPREWHWLIERFRQRLMPLLLNQSKSYPQKALLSREQFIEEVFEETLLKFYELFGSGSFQQYADLEATVVTVAKYKVKEGFSRLKKEKKWYFMEAAALAAMCEKILGEQQEWEQEQLERIAEVKKHLGQMEGSEKELLSRFFNGEELQDIAEDLKISPAACRKRKQRVLQKLRDAVMQTLGSILF